MTKMKRFSKICVFFLLSLLVVQVGFSKSKKKSSKSEVTAPLWTTEEGRNKLFPKAEYLTASAFGSSAEDAKSKAAAEISASIKAQVASNVQSSYAASDSDGVSSYRKTLSQNVDVSSDNALYQLEYTVPFYSPDYGMYVCLAYINRAKAFAALNPKLDAASQHFVKAYALARDSADDFEKVLALEKAKGSLNEFYEIYDFLLALVPEQASEYSKVDKLAGDCQLQINQIKKRIQIFIDSEKCERSRVADKVSDIFTDRDFIVVKKGAYDYKVSVTVKTEITKNGDLYITYPFVDVEVFKGASTYYSFSEKLEKCAGFDEKTALNRADFELCKLLEEKLLKF